ncbi:PREDICTED: uncharacterized protein LOC105959319 [Erythranthe guttata]|uniref:uncharacterized protein LOC105959319 n=1 Tax=Erythranthe guttata TaxID=4155 RepID=UPI00064E0341|nr:PREDICTED: uncharacterized protein LOC105959319 [Erythranthe guttata]|eukprot:XP_012838845.1 PREDICTED: uncharacterized protein LOC105959319 [Erythranthe guttata]
MRPTELHQLFSDPKVVAEVPRLVPSRTGLTEEFKAGVDEFICFALSQVNFVSEGDIRCPCSRCDNMGFLNVEDVKTHLYKYGFVPEYYQWISHGDPYINHVSPQTENEAAIQTTPSDPYRTMVLEAAGLGFDFEFDRNDFVSDEGELPNSVAGKFYELLKATEEPLYEGCKLHTPLSATSRLVNIKSEFNMSGVCFNQILQLMKELVPNDNKLPTDFYKTKKMVRNLGLGYKKIDVCVNECILYFKENQDLKVCSVCGHSRYKPRKRGNEKQKEISYKILRYFPLTPRLQRLFMSSKTSEHMTWHKKSRRESGTISHPCDGEAWKHFDTSYPSFAVEPRNVRLALSSDGFSPYGQKSHPYSCWPVIITPYNLPPGMCMTTPYMFLSLVIPGPKSPGKNIDVYLQPLVNELNELWEVGVETYDSFNKQNFQMRAALMWTINDFPAYGMLSGWSTHGVSSCPLCMGRSKAFFLKEGKKPSYFDCHRQFLPMNHPFRKDKKSFRKGSVEKSTAPDGSGPSLHTGGSIPMSEYKRRYVKENGKEPSASELFLMTHKTKENNDWVDKKSKLIWEKFKNSMKKRRLDNRFETQDNENDDATIDDEDGEEDDSGDEAFMTTIATLPKELVDNVWLEVTGGPTKGRIYGVGSESSNILQGVNHISNGPTFSSSAPPNYSQSFVNSPIFQEAVNRAIKDKFEQMEAAFEEKLQARIEAATQAMNRSQ